MKPTSPLPPGSMEEVLERYGNMLYRLCILQLKNESDAQDAIQETLIRYFRKAPPFESGEHEKAWLIRVATNQCRDMLRYRAKHPQIDEEIFGKIAAETPDSGILEALGEVPERYRLVLTLYYVEDCRIEEIAKIIGRTPSAVKMRLQKGRKLLENIYREAYL